MHILRHSFVHTLQAGIQPTLYKFTFTYLLTKKSGLVASYDIRPGNGAGLFW